MRNPTVKHIKLGEIHVDPRLETRPVDPSWVRHLEEAREVGDDLEPITVAPYGKVYVLLDGRNRLEVYKRAFGEGWKEAKIAVEIKECKDSDEMMKAAILGNRRHGKPLTPGQRNALYVRLTREMGWSKKQTKEVLGITTDHAEKYESQLIRMRPAEGRATHPEKTTRRERAIDMESTNPMERSGKGFPAPSRQTEGWASARDNKARTIEFHLERLKAALPGEWERSRKAVIDLEKAIITDMKETTNE